jgi:hypothetical protein
MRKRGLLCIAMLAAGAVAGSFAADTTNAIPSPELSASELLSAAEVVTLRFPHDWDDVTTASAPPAMALASADSAAPQTLPSALIFAGPAMAPPVTARTEIHAAPEQMMAYAPDPAPARAMPGTPRVKTAALTPPPVKRPAQAAPQSRFLFNDAQINSIKNRLKLSPDQEAYWPAVEKALRSIAHEKAPASKQAASAASINPNSPQVQQLKSAAIPLVMVLREEQKREVRMLAHVMGLSSVASQF